MTWDAAQLRQAQVDDGDGVVVFARIVQPRLAVRRHVHHEAVVAQEDVDLGGKQRFVFDDERPHWIYSGLPGLPGLPRGVLTASS